MYQYENEKAAIFTEDGQNMFLKIRDNVNSIIPKSGAIRLGEAIKATSGNSWTMLACIDRMVELGELKEIKYGDCAGQNRIFVQP